MTWVLIYKGDHIATGSFWTLIGEAEDRELCLRRQHEDGTELAPKWPRDLILIPALMFEMMEGRV